MAQQMAAGDIKVALSQHNINVSESEGSGNLVSFQQRGLSGVVRASLHYYNTDEEIDYFVDALHKILQ